MRCVSAVPSLLVFCCGHFFAAEKNDAPETEPAQKIAHLLAMKRWAAKRGNFEAMYKNHPNVNREVL